jgi:hypothetical protein
MKKWIFSYDNRASIVDFPYDFPRSMLTMRTLGRGVSAPGLVSPRTQPRSGQVFTKSLCQIFPQLADDGRWMIYDGV